MDYQGRGAQDGHVDQVQVQCRFMSTELETMTIMDGERRTAALTVTLLLSSVIIIQSLL